MTDTQWADISEWQAPVSDSYPYNFIAIRSNDGNHIDKNIQANLSWCKSRRASGKLWGFMVYYFYRPGIEGAKNLMAQVGTPDPRMVAMIDVESAGGQVSGNQSSAINAQFNELASWLGDPRRVVGYGNTSDLGTLWPSKPPGIRLVIAAYGSKPSYPGMYAHQFTDKGSCTPFGSCDMNSADGMTQQDLSAMYGFSGSPSPPSKRPPPRRPPSPTRPRTTSACPPPTRIATPVRAGRPTQVTSRPGSSRWPRGAGTSPRTVSSAVSRSRSAASSSRSRGCRPTASSARRPGRQAGPSRSPERAGPYLRFRVRLRLWGRSRRRPAGSTGPRN